MDIRVCRKLKSNSLCCKDWKPSLFVVVDFKLNKISYWRLFIFVFRWPSFEWKFVCIKALPYNLMREWSWQEMLFSFAYIFFNLRDHPFVFNINFKIFLFLRSSFWYLWLTKKNNNHVNRVRNIGVIGIPTYIKKTNRIDNLLLFKIG